MRPIALVLGALAALPACSVSVGVPAAAPPTFEAITSAGQFLEQVAGKPITFENGGVLIVNPDGTFSGDFGGIEPQGSWEFVNGQLCRTITIGAQQFPEVCNLLEASDKGLRFLNPDGTLSSEAVLG